MTMQPTMTTAPATAPARMNFILKTLAFPHGSLPDEFAGNDIRHRLAAMEDEAMARRDREAFKASLRVWEEAKSFYEREKLYREQREEQERRLRSTLEHESRHANTHTCQQASASPSPSEEDEDSYDFESLRQFTPTPQTLTPPPPVCGWHHAPGTYKEPHLGSHHHHRHPSEPVIAPSPSSPMQNKIREEFYRKVLRAANCAAAGV